MTVTEDIGTRPATSTLPFSPPRCGYSDRERSKLQPTTVPASAATASSRRVNRWCMEAPFSRARGVHERESSDSLRTRFDR